VRYDHLMSAGRGGMINVIFGGLDSHFPFETPEDVHFFVVTWMMRRSLDGKFKLMEGSYHGYVIIISKGKNVGFSSCSEAEQIYQLVEPCLQLH